MCAGEKTTANHISKQRSNPPRLIHTLQASFDFYLLGLTGIVCQRNATNYLVTPLATIVLTFVNGVTISELPNFFVGSTGHYYFPGMYTAVLPMIPGIYGIIRIVRWRKIEQHARISSKEN